MPGSGTRVIARAAQVAGYYMGEDLSRALDARHFRRFADRWVDRSLRSWANARPLADEVAMKVDFSEFLERHRAGMDNPNQRWGWKAPRSICFLPCLERVCPGFRFVHVVRDGRDIAFKQFGRRAVEDADGPSEPWRARAAMGHLALLGEEFTEASSTRVKMALWGRLNEMAADYGESLPMERYLRVRLEDLCSLPEQRSRELLRFILLGEPPAEVVSAVAAAVAPSRSLGHWRERDPIDVRDVAALAARGLARFGYR